MKRLATLLLISLLLLTFCTLPVMADTPQVDPLQKFFVYSIHLGGDDGKVRTELAALLKPLTSTDKLTDETVAAVHTLLPEMTADEVKNALTLYTQRSAENQSNIQTLIIFGKRELPFADQMPSIASKLNRYIIGDPEDNRGANFFSTLLALGDIVTLIYPGESRVASNYEAPVSSLVKLTVSPDMSAGVISNLSGALNLMPSFSANFSNYPGNNSVEKLFLFVEELVNDCSTEEIYAFKLAMKSLRVFFGEVLEPSGNTKYEGLTFRDLDSYDWAIDQIRRLSGSGIVNGINRYVFAPGQSVTREQFVKLIASAFSLTSSTDAPLPFTDVASQEWYAPYVRAAYEAEIVSGVSATEFGIGQSITREQMATMLYRACQKKGISFAGGEPAAFTDAAEIQPYAADAVAAMSSHKIIKGMGDGRFAPSQQADRAQAVVMLDNILTFIEN